MSEDGAPGILAIRVAVLDAADHAAPAASQRWGESGGVRLWTLLRRRRSPQEDWWLVRSAQTLVILAPGTSAAVAAILAAFGQHDQVGLAWLLARLLVWL